MKRTLTFLLFLCMGMGLSAQDATRIQQFKDATGAEVTIEQSTQTPSFVRIPATRALRFSGSLQERANAFLAEHGAIFGVENASEELRTQAITRDKMGFQRFTMEQHYQDVPVFDGKLHFHFNINEDISAVNGNFIPNIDLNSRPRLSLTAAALIAVEEITEQEKDGLNAPLYVNKNTLYVFNKGFALGTPELTYLVYEVEVRNDLDVREYLYIDAHKGNVVEQYTGMCTALFRRLYETNTGNQVWQEGDALPGGLDQWQQTEVIAAGHSYNFFENAFGYTSYDDNDAEMQTINNNPAINCPNASWNGTTANYCDGTAADDVVAHEWGHAYTEYTNGLIYAYQAGAMNEAFSDIWGETIDLFNNYEDADDDDSPRTNCNNSDRWRMGEDATAFGGAIRDMWTPTCDGDPGKVTDGVYRCGTGDSGGVHSNSGVPNHAYAMLVDGDTYNGQTINAIGFTKAAHIFWRAQSVYLTKTSDFAVLADALEQACQDLVGINLEGLSTTGTPAGLSGEIITAADCAAVAAAVLATELRTDPAACGYAPMLSAAPAVCGTGTPANVLFSEDWEAGIGAWTVSQAPTNAGTWDARDWVIDNSLPDGRAGAGAFGINALFGDCQTDLDNGVIELISPVINLNATATGPLLMTFDHYVSIEDEYDGAHLYYRNNGGAWTLLPGSAFTANPYNKNLTTTAAGNDNPRAGVASFSGADGGSVSGTWGQSQVDLSAIGVTPGDALELRFEVSGDGCNGWDGWYVDDIVIYSCSAPAGPLVTFSSSASGDSEAQANVDNGCLDYYEATISVQIGAAPSQAVDVTVTTTGTATMGAMADYTFTPNTFTLDGANLTQDIIVRIYNDAVIEGNETIIFNYTFNANGGDGSAGSSNQTHTLTINDDDFVPSNTVSGSIFADNFDAGIGAWTVTNGGNGPDTWQGIANYGGTSNLDGTPFLFVDSDDPGNGNTMYEIIESPIINTAGATNMMLSLDQYFRVYNAAYIEMALIEVFDGTAWQNVSTQDQGTGTLGFGAASNPLSIAIPDAYANTNMQIRFIYDAQWDYWWAIDNVELTGETSTIVQSPVNTGTGDEQYLGPNEEVYFYDPTTGNIMVRIKNLTAHDYGCTTVEVERAGITASNGWDASATNYVVDKTFQVTPTNANTAGDYEISLYYTEAEIAGWEAASGLTRAELKHAHSINNMPTPMPADIHTYLATTVGAYGADWTYTATYSSTSFIDFGLAKEEQSLAIAPKVFLQGPFSGAAMLDNLRASGLVPMTEPYTGTGYSFTGGGGGESTTAGVLAVMGTKAVIDWVVVEIRDAAGTMVLSSRSALLLADGTVVEVDGISAVKLSGIVASATAGQNYHVAIRHRNHLGVMTNTPIALD